MKCVICKKNEANQKHHVSYEPELIIDICKLCHQKIHQSHGVGLGEGEVNSKIKESHPFFTYASFDRDKKQYFIRDSTTGEDLNIITCKCGSCRFSLYGRSDKSALYIRCNQCGVDRSVTTMDSKQSEGSPQLKLDEVSQT